MRRESQASMGIARFRFSLLDDLYSILMELTEGVHVVCQSFCRLNKILCQRFHFYEGKEILRLKYGVWTQPSTKLSHGLQSPPSVNQQSRYANRRLNWHIKHYFLQDG